MRRILGPIAVTLALLLVMAGSASQASGQTARPQVDAIVDTLGRTVQR